MEIVLFISSENSINSPRVEYQIGRAANLYKTILTFNIDGSQLTREMRFYLMNNQFIVAYPNPEEHFDDLLVEVSRLIDDSSIIEWGKTEESGGENIESSSHEGSASKDNKSYKPKDFVKPLKAYDGDEPYIFISYKHADTDLIIPILKRFTERGYNIWFDQGLQYGDDYDDLIDFKIDGSALFVIFITETVIEGAYDSDEYMKKELDVALDTGTKIFPIFLQDVGLKGKYRMHLRGKHSIFLHEYASEDEFIDDCITAFRKDFEIEPLL